MNKNIKIYSLKGMKDYNEDKSCIWNYLFNEIKLILHSYGFKFINFPILENTFLFNKSINNNDLFVNEMYSFKDRKNRNISLRPEGTSCCIRFGIENGLLRGQKHKWWYFGPMFRYEKPQLCRYREFYQLGIEAFGFDNVNVELELFLLISNFFKKINILDKLTLEINFLGSLKTKDNYSKYLIDFFKKNISIFSKFYTLDKLLNNPFKILEIKDKNIINFMIKNMYKINNFLSIDDNKYFKKILELLNFFKISYKINYFLVRGINYYNNIIFEWKTDKLGSQSSICSGGRYNGLTEKLGGISIPSIGLAIGWDRLIELFIKINGLKDFIKNNDKNNKILITSVNIKYIKHVFLLSENIRNIFSKFIVYTDYSISSINKKINYVLKNSIFYMIIIYKISYNNDIILFKNMSNFKQEYINSIEKVLDFMKKNIKY